MYINLTPLARGAAPSPRTSLGYRAGRVQDVFVTWRGASGQIFTRRTGCRECKAWRWTTRRLSNGWHWTGEGGGERSCLRRGQSYLGIPPPGGGTAEGGGGRGGGLVSCCVITTEILREGTMDFGPSSAAGGGASNGFQDVMLRTRQFQRHFVGGMVRLW